jgi:hypothetical protein
MHHDQGKEIQLEDLDKYERNLPLVFEPSEAESVLENNCDGVRFEFHLERHWEVE